MLSRQLDSINESDLVALVSNGVRESRSLEFKAKLVWATESERKEFLADVSAFANGGGGDLVFGIEEHDGAASAVVGLDSFDPDGDTLKMESLIRDGIAPRIIGVRPWSVALRNGRRVVLVRVPNSLNRPHMVALKNWSRFYSRNSAGKYQLDVHELRSAFVASEAVTERARQFRVERIDAILQGNTPARLAGTSYICIHMMPISAFDPYFSFDLSKPREQREQLPPIRARGWNPSVNFDGLLFASSAHAGGAGGYVQLFRNGIVEALDCQLLAPTDPHHQGPEKYIPSIAYEECLIRAVGCYTAFYRKYEVPTPVLVGLSVLNVRGFHMAADLTDGLGNRIDREHLILPDRLAETLDFDAASFLRPCFDQIWNACGHDRSLNYDEQGNWTPRR